MSGVSHDEYIKKQVTIYIRVFVALAVLTVVTVAISYLHLPVLPAIIVALLIATFKASLVAAYFMHLVSEKKIVLALLALASVFFLVLLFSPILAHH